MRYKTLLFYAIAISYYLISSVNAATIIGFDPDPLYLRPSGVDMLTVTISEPATFGGEVLSISSSDPGIITVPASVVVLPDNSTATIPVFSLGVTGEGLVTASLGASYASASVIITDVMPGEIIINEIMQNPYSAYDSAGEWFELFNPTASDIDINGLTIADDDYDTHVINNGGPLIITTGGFLILGNNGDYATNGGVNVDYEYGPNWFLANSGDEIILLTDSLIEIDRVEYDSEPNFPAPNGASMALKNPALDNNIGANWCTSTVTFGDGDFGTPGVINDCYVALCEGDFDTDGDVDGSDLAIFAADFGRTDCSGDCEGDFDADSDVDGSDLAVFAADFGRTDCP